MPFLAFLWFRDGRLKIPPIPYILPGAADSRPIFPDPPVRPAPGGIFFAAEGGGAPENAGKGRTNGNVFAGNLQGEGKYLSFSD